MIELCLFNSLSHFWTNSPAAVSSEGIKLVNLWSIFLFTVHNFIMIGQSQSIFIIRFSNNLYSLPMTGISISCSLGVFRDLFCIQLGDLERSIRWGCLVSKFPSHFLILSSLSRLILILFKSYKYWLIKNPEFVIYFWWICGPNNLWFFTGILSQYNLWFLSHTK